MPDVEVKLNIEAEYKQALQAIADMGDALEEVQKKAKNLTDATKNAQGGNNTDPASLEALNKASKELSENMAKVAAAGKKAQDALKAISELKPQSEESIQLLEKAAAGYEKLAEMAKNAADAAERFNKVGSAGLTTEEMLRQAQAVEKHLAALKQQSEALERNIASQKEQLNLLRQKNAEEAKAAQLNQQRERQEQLNIALLDKQAKAEEEAHFKMQLANKTRLELVNIIKELTARYKEASAAQDVEAMQKYERQLTLANQALRKVNMNARVANIALMQQAQAAQRIGQNLTTLVDGFNNLGEAAKNGELNLVSLGSSIVSLTRDIKAGLGPIGWVMLALQGLQAVYNEHAKREKSIAESVNLHKEAVKATADAYTAVKTAREAYLKQKQREQTITELNVQYQALNATLQTGLDIINAQTAAELRRLQLTQDDAKFQQTLKKHELGRQLSLGLISQDDYNLALLHMDKDMAVGGAKNRMTQAGVKKEAATATRKKTHEQFVTAKNMFEQAEYDAAQFTVSTEELDAAEGKIKELEEKQEAARKRLEEVFKKYNINYRGLFSALGEGYQFVATEGIRRNLNNILGTNFQGVYEEAQQDIKEAEEAYRNATRGLTSFKTDIITRIGGKSFSDYRSDKQTAEERLGITKSQYDKLSKDAQDAVKNESEATTAYNDSVNAFNKVTWQQNELVKSEEKNIKARKEGAKKRAKEEQKLEQLKNIVNNLTEKSLKHELELAQKDANSTDSIISEEGKERVAYITGILNQRANNRTRTYARFYGDGKLTRKEDTQLRTQLEQAIAEQDAEKIELYKWLLSLKNSVKKNNNEAKKTRRLLGR